MAGMEGISHKAMLILQHFYSRNLEGISAKASSAHLLKNVILFSFNHCTEPRDVLPHKTGGSTPTTSNKKSSRSKDLELFPWLGRRNLFQLFDDDMKCDIEEIRQLLDDDKANECAL
jgi:hypothetical protein